ncbi:MAG: hypothetical protein ACKO0W_06930 [Planctomycetota bacterium]
MNNQPHSHRRRTLSSGAALLACSLAATTESNAAIQRLNLGPSGFNVLGVNAGLAPNSARSMNLPFVGCVMQMYSGYYGYTGLVGDGYLSFAVTGGRASPRNFASGASIDGTALFASYATQSLFSYFVVNYYDDVSPNFNAGSFMGFRFSTDLGTTFNYGWLEVLWDGTDWEILAGAYESTAGVAIRAGAVPLPGAAGLAACGLLGLSRRRRR